MPRKHCSEAEKHRLCESFKQSGLPATKFAEANGLGKSTLSRWLSEFKSANEPRLVPIAQQVSAGNRHEAPNKTVIDFILPNGIVFKVPIGKDIDLLIDIIQAFSHEFNRSCPKNVVSYPARRFSLCH